MGENRNADGIKENFQKHTAQAMLSHENMRIAEREDKSFTQLQRHLRSTIMFGFVWSIWKVVIVS